jgi:hypothetical protein
MVEDNVELQFKMDDVRNTGESDYSPNLCCQAPGTPPTCSAGSSRGKTSARIREDRDAQVFQYLMNALVIYMTGPHLG